MSDDNMRTPLARARGLGSAQTGAGHWWQQRLTALALLLLGIWFVALTLGLLHAGYASAHAMLAQPLNALLMIAFTAVAFWHAQLGLQVVIEDYVHTRWLALTLQIGIKFIAALGALACALAVLRIALGS
ncbi:MAG: succinate dehydrogenase, hydrophobic membrane anchor protein [Xanthomonadaceae bacterium]|nr:succinate dehydrogenase, hydrophobic membrane anchor protein [Xanthomonadaceae bacterium]MDE1958971.1 succinate dehydrogenase, hydrophobic membrane anchor protein [Xanthomonadaceae bacterium]MDE2178682.1 succinate dehydrogenase, hydrophobic membrane anchor protein [Xanthomonadaceae bacterium]MDE2246918.1 succinate dehydrogenase, hydrophobic membrane anchor protein [Xanthomonadaceae bacterium]